MAMLNISQAARMAGVDRATIHRAIASGKLSATLDENGRRVIDEAELGRVFNTKPILDNSRIAPGQRVSIEVPPFDMGQLLEQARASVDADRGEDVAVLQERVRGLEELRDTLRQQLQAQQAAMEALTLRLPPPAATSQPAGSGLVWAVVGLMAAVALGVAVVVLK